MTSKPIEVKPTQGGKLMTAVSSDMAGIANYTVKRDWRRVLEHETRSEGHDWFFPDPTQDRTAQCTPPGVDGPITVIAMARQPNGRIAVVAGTATTIWRFYGMEDGHYVIDGYWVAGYYNDAPGVWVVIGSGYTANARRWEAVNINGYLVLNNGVDLPFTYRVEDLQAYPIYELREQGIAAVGTIAEQDGILLCMDLHQIDADRLTQLLSPVPFTRNLGQAGVVSSGTTRAVVNNGTAGVAGNTITASDATFNGGVGFTGMVGKAIRMANGMQRTITAVTSSTVATIDGVADLAEPNQMFYLPTAAGTEYQIPLDFTTDIIASCNTSAVTVAAAALATAQTNLTNASALLASDQAILTAFQAVAAGSLTGTALADALVAAQTALILNPNNTSLQAAVAAATAALVITPAPSPANIAAAQAAVNAAAATVETTTLAFNAAQLALQSAQDDPNANSDTDVAAYLANQNMVVGLNLYWDSGEVRTITGWYNAGVIVDSDQPIPAGACSLENPLAYKTFPYQAADQQNVQRIQYRVFWGMPNQPRRWGAILPCTIDPTSNRIQLKYPAKSVPELVTRDFLVLGAGNGGGNLQVTASWALDNQIVDATAAITTAAMQLEEALLQAKFNQGNAAAAASSATATQNLANNSLVTARAALNAAIPNYTDLFNALQSAQESADETQASLDTANQNYAISQTNLAAAQNALAASPGTLALQQAVNTATAAVATAQEVVLVAQTAVTVAQNALSTAQSAINTTPKEADLVAAVATATAQVQSAQALVVSTSQALLTSNTALLAAQQSILPINSTMEAADAYNSIIAFDDLQDDGSAILKAASLKGTLVIFKESNVVFLATYTGDITTPFQFQKILTPEGTELYYRNTLVQVKGANVMWQTVSALYLIYAGRNAFYRFDLTNQVPVEIPDFQMCQDLLFGQNPDQERAFVADNAVTKELFFCNPNATTDAVLRYDYRFNTVSTSAAVIYAAALTYRPTSNFLYTDEWFLMGGAGGVVLRYGRVNDNVQASGAITASIAAGSTTLTASAPFFTNAHVGQSVRFNDDTMLAIVGITDSTHATVVGSAVKVGQPFKMVNAIWHRLGVGYDSVLQSGMESFGSPDSEKMLVGYVPYLTSDSPSTPLNLVFRGALNPKNARDIIATTIQDPQSRNLVKPTMQQFYLGDRITVSGMNNPCELSMRSFRFAPINSQSFGRGK